MNDDTKITFLVEIDFRLPNQAETLEAYSQEISGAFAEQLTRNMPKLLSGLVDAWEAKKLKRQPLADGRVRVTYKPEKGST